MLETWTSLLDEGDGVDVLYFDYIRRMIASHGETVGETNIIWHTLSTVQVD